LLFGFIVAFSDSGTTEGSGLVPIIVKEMGEREPFAGERTLGQMV
jgi:hypothetical protein